MRRPVMGWGIGVTASLLLVTAAFAQAGTQAARLHAGTCEAPGASVADLTGVDGPIDESARPALEAVALALGDGARVTSTRLRMPLSELGAGNHVIVVVEGETGEGATAACGELPAFESETSDIQVGLAGPEGSSVSGVAWLHDNGDGTTTVWMVVGGPAPDPALEAPPQEVAVAITGSFYRPDPLEVLAGTTVTWTNEDLTPHTTTAAEGGFDSGYMPQGAFWSHTFETPGTYPIYCVFHPRMRATVIVR